METKTQKAIQLLKAGELLPSIRIFCTFRIGFTKEEHRTLQIAKDVLNGHGAFYTSIGVDGRQKVEESVKILHEKYLKR